ncbi:hypothetical protein KBD18_00285 [Patescibacteria group bacterium]|nr:hypothetical protein [Patescibacteria group bacterium]
MHVFLFFLGAALVATFYRTVLFFFYERTQVAGLTRREQVNFFFRPFRLWWLRLGHALEWLNTRLLLGTIYFVLVGVYAIVLKGVGVCIPRRKNPPTYWKPRSSPDPTEAALRRAF